MDKKKNTAVALGFFDGLHKGHMSLINATIASARADNLEPVVIFFDNHPKKLLSKNPPKTILQKHIKTQMIENLGAKIYHVSFKQIMNYSPREFFEVVLLAQLAAKTIVCGENYHFGKGGKGDCAMLESLCLEHEVKFIQSKLIEHDGDIISSTRIRNLIENGEVKKANELLNHEFMFEFEVFSGDKRGRTLGFPTINQYFEDGFIVPRFGVYCSRIYLDDKRYLGVTNVGIRPSVETKKMRSETYIDGFSGNLYGEKVRVCLLEFLRDERKFDNLQDLENQIKQDLQNAKDAYKDK